MAKHIVTAFDNDLRRIQKDVIKMGKAVAQMWVDCIVAVSTASEAQAEKVVNFDKKIDSMEINIYDEGFQLLALRAPIAQDLRIALSALRVGTNLERAADHAKAIARRALLIKPEQHRTTVSLLNQMNTIALSNLHNVLEAYKDNDVEAAEIIRNNDANLDELFNAVLLEIVQAMTAKNPLEEAQALAHLMFVAKGIERMGDIVTNIAEIIIFQETARLPTDERTKSSSDTLFQSKSEE